MSGTDVVLHQTLNECSSEFAATWHTLMRLLRAQLLQGACGMPLVGACQLQHPQTGVSPVSPLPPPRLYWNLTGPEGLAADDPNWLPSSLHRLGIGGSFTTCALAEGRLPLPKRLDARGWWTWALSDESSDESGEDDDDDDEEDELGDEEDEEEVGRHTPQRLGSPNLYRRGRSREVATLIDSDLVCFLQEPPSRSGYHALVPSPRGRMEDDTHHLPPFATVTLVGVDGAGEWSEEPAGKPVRRARFRVRVSYGC